jgi:hypothetical protein
LHPPNCTIIVALEIVIFLIKVNDENKVYIGFSTSA